MNSVKLFLCLGLLWSGMVLAQPPSSADELPEISMQRILASEDNEDIEPPKMTMEDWLIEQGFLGREQGPSQRNHALLASLYAQYDEWRDVRYRLGGFSKSGVDCSGFAKLTFAELFNISLPRNTGGQAQTGMDIARDELQTGDLVFFRIDRDTQHVGIYLERNKFLHASTSQGVMISDVAHPYWRKRYWKSVRHQLPEQTARIGLSGRGT